MNDVFLIPEPEPGDTRPRNAFGILKGFGEAAAAYYAKQDREHLERTTMNTQEAIACLALRLKGADLLGDTQAVDLVEWRGLVELDGDDLVRLEALARDKKFQAWMCPTCGNRVYFGSPDDWDHFQGVSQLNYTSYPAGHPAQCDHCRCYNPQPDLNVYLTPVIV